MAGPKLPFGDPSSGSLHSLLTFVGTDLNIDDDLASMKAELAPFLKLTVCKTWKITWVAFQSIGNTVPPVTPQRSFEIWGLEGVSDLGVSDKLQEVEWIGRLRDKLQILQDDGGAKQALSILLERRDLAAFALQSVLTREEYTKTGAAVTITANNQTKSVWVRVPMRLKGARTRADQVNIEAIVSALSGDEEGNRATAQRQVHVVADLVAALGRKRPAGVLRGCRILHLIVAKQQSADLYNCVKARLNLKEKQLRGLIRILQPSLGYLFPGHQAVFRENKT